MANNPITTKAELLAEIERDWAALLAALDRLSPSQCVSLHDKQGWTVKDHLHHLAAWERSAACFLQGQPRHTGLEVEAGLYLAGDEDALNAAIYQRARHLSFDEALARLRAAHQQLLQLLEPLADADLQRPYRHYLPDKPGEGAGPPALNVIYGNSAHHFREHLVWIEALVKDNP